MVERDCGCVRCVLAKFQQGGLDIFLYLYEIKIEIIVKIKKKK